MENKSKDHSIYNGDKNGIVREVTIERFCKILMTVYDKDDIISLDESDEIYIHERKDGKVVLAKYPINYLLPKDLNSLMDKIENDFEKYSYEIITCENSRRNTLIKTMEYMNHNGWEIVQVIPKKFFGLVPPKIIIRAPKNPRVDKYLKEESCLDWK